MPRQQPSVLDPLPAACRTARSFAHGGSAFHKRWMCFAACLLLWAPRPHPAAAQAPDHPAPRPMQFADLMKMRRLGDSTLSPNGKWVLFSVTDADLERNTRTSHLWVIPAAGGQEKPVTASSAGESRGRFSPDGKQILFTSSREGSPQIYLASFDDSSGNAGEAKALTSLSTGADGALWSPDGQNVLFLSNVYPDCSSNADPAACNKQRDEKQENSKVRAQLLTHLLARHWNTFTGDKRSHLFLVPASGGIPRDLNAGDARDIPPFSIGGADGYAFSPDSKEVAFEENLDPEPAISTNADIFTLRLDDPSAKPVKVSTSPGGDFSPAYSPDGKYIAWRSQARAGYESGRFRLMLYDRQSKQLKEPLPNFDRWIDEFAWSADSKTIYFVAADRGEAPVFEVDAPFDDKYSQKINEKASIPVRRITAEGEYSNLLPSPSGQYLIAAKMSVTSPGKLVMLDTKLIGHEMITEGLPRQRPLPIAHELVVPEVRLTHLNDETLADLDLPKMEKFWFRGALNTRVQGFIIRPPGFDAVKKYPVKFLIHGGPEGAWGNSWSYRWNPELFAADGYVVVMVNPRGSTGYGQQFIDQIDGDWGGKPYIDLMRGLDYAEQHFPFIDKSRECALGASYGGYMADWILGHTDRFACIVSHDGMFNTESAYGETDELWFPEWEFKGTPWTNRLTYRRWSPMLFAARMKTPTLVIHGQLDYRLELSQGLQLYTTLQRLKVPSEMLYFPDEGHWVLKPQNSQLWYSTVDAWCDKWTHTNQQPSAVQQAP
jgi:dipeptidyl aminopeptidase/acylaminoacyl peptidase